MSYKPVFSISPSVVQALVDIESIKKDIIGLPITPQMLLKLRESARYESIHYSTKIEGNRLTLEQVNEVIDKKKHFAGRERDEKEVKGYYAALDFLERYVASNATITEHAIQTMHALVMGAGKTNVKPTLYRDGQNSIRESGSNRLVYLPPEAKDVPDLMGDMVDWVNGAQWPAPIIASIAHYQLATIHPYFDGNGRTSRLLATLILHTRGYDLKGIYSLDAYYANDLTSYYEALTVGPSHNYYIGRAEADISPWVEYFCLGLIESFEKIYQQAKKASFGGGRDISEPLKKLNSKQRKVLELFQKGEVVARDIGECLGLKGRTTRALCQKWVEEGFLVMSDASKKGRSYKLGDAYAQLLENL
jgi:Fic family protein